MFTNLEVYAEARRQEIDHAVRLATLEGRVIRDIPGSKPRGRAIAAIRRAFRGMNAGPARRSGPRAGSPSKA